MRKCTVNHRVWYISYLHTLWAHISYANCNIHLGAPLTKFLVLLCWLKIRQFFMSNGIGYIVSIQSVQKETFIINVALMQKFRKSEYKYKSWSCLCFGKSIYIRFSLEKQSFVELLGCFGSAEPKGNPGSFGLLGIRSQQFCPGPG